MCGTWVFKILHSIVTYTIKQFRSCGILEHHEMKAVFVEPLHFHGTHWLISGCVAVKAGTRIPSMWCTTPAAEQSSDNLTIPASYLHHSFYWRKCVVDLMMWQFVGVPLLRRWRLIRDDYTWIQPTHYTWWYTLVNSICGRGDVQT